MDNIQPQATRLRTGDAAHRVDTYAVPPGTIEPYPLKFTGSGGEFFRIWLVNLLLNVVTLGFYTPFARRRTAQYFYGHTDVAESPLEFAAQQKKMTLGFLIVVFLYLAFRVASDTGQDVVVTLFLFGIAVAAPYLWGSAMRFRLNATRWRGIRLRFAASHGEIYRASWPVFVIAATWAAFVVTAAALEPEGGYNKDAIGPMLGVTLVALAITFFCVVRLEYNYKRLLVAQARIGGEPGRWNPVYADFLRIWLMTLLLLVVGAVAVTSVMALFATGVAAAFRGKGALGIVLAVLIVLLTIVLLFFASSPARAYREARIFQLVWNNVGVSTIARFKCNLRTSDYVLLRLKNMVLSLLTLGFYRPFAMISEYRMKTDSVTLHVKGGLEQLAGRLARDEQGIGDAIADAAGLDLVG